MPFSRDIKNGQQKNISYNLFRFWKILGPGLVTGASDDDPSGIATYSQAGAAYGLSTLWTALITFPLMASIQEMCARIGLVTSHGLAGTNAAYILFAVGVIGTGLLAIPVLCGSLSYIITETFGWKEGLNKKFHKAKGFYIIIAISLIMGLSLDHIGISPMKALIYSAIL